MKTTIRIVFAGAVVSSGGCFDPADPLVIEASQTDGSTGPDAGPASTNASGSPNSGTGGPSTSSASSPTSSPDPSPTSGPDPTDSTDSGVTTRDSVATTQSSDSDDSGDTGSATGSDSDESGGEETMDSSACVPDCGGIACGVDPVCDADCPDQCSAAATCAADQSYCALALGNPDYLGTYAEVVGGIMFGHRVTIPSNTTLKSLGVIAGDAGPAVQLAIYTDSNGPQTRMRQTGEFVVQDDVNEVDVPDTTLTAGDYWIMIHTEDLTSLGRTESGDFQHEFAYVFESYPATGADSFPLTLDDDQIVEDYRYNLYIVVEE